MEPKEFGPSLRRERERQGITLQDIAERTKIRASLFAEMERNDFSHWPAGIFRRSFLRSYAEVLGLDAERLVRQFVQLFPCDDDCQHAVIAEHAAHRPTHRTPAVVVVHPSSAALRHEEKPKATAGERFASLVSGLIDKFAARTGKREAPRLLHDVSVSRRTVRQVERNARF